jgi:hypothetical protein
MWVSSSHPTRSAVAGGVASPQCWGRWVLELSILPNPSPQTVRRLLAALLPLNGGVSGEKDLFLCSSSTSPNRSAAAGGVAPPQCWGEWGGGFPYLFFILLPKPFGGCWRRSFPSMLGQVGVDSCLGFSSSSPNRSAAAGGAAPPQCWGEWGGGSLYLFFILLPKPFGGCWRLYSPSMVG